MEKPGEDNSINPRTLGNYLSSIRADRKMTLRDVEEATGKEVSNAYLSQIENGKIKKPSPNILHSLSEIYGIEFDNLMRMAGFVTSSNNRNNDERHGKLATFSEQNLTIEEEAALVEYLQFLRTRK